MTIETRNHTLNTSHGLLAEEESGQGKLPLLLMPVFGNFLVRLYVSAPGILPPDRRRQRVRRPLQSPLAVSLAFFRYTGFVSTSFSRLERWLGVNLSNEVTTPVLGPSDRICPTAHPFRLTLAGQTFSPPSATTSFIKRPAAGGRPCNWSLTPQKCKWL